GIIAGKLTGRRDFPDPPEMAAARGLAAPARPLTSRRSTAAAALLLALVVALATVTCRGRAAAAPLDEIRGTVFAAGDNAYPHGSASDDSTCCPDAPPRLTPAGTGRPGPSLA